jgi:hypothetical protein
MISTAGAGRMALADAPSGWQNEIRLTNDAGTSFTAPNNCKWLAVDPNGIVHVVWLDDRDRNFEIYHKMRSGGIWLDDERVTNDPAYSARPNLAVDGSGWLHLVWNDERDGNKEIYHKVWAGMWSGDQRVTDTSGESFASSIVAEGDTIHLVYLEGTTGNLQVMYRSLVDNRWSAPFPLTNVPTGDRMVPAIDIGPDRSLHVVWWDTREDTAGVNGKIYYRRTSGSMWLDEELLTDPANDAMRPDVAVDDSGCVHVAWIDSRGSFEQIYYRRRGPGGWEKEIALTNEPVTHYHPSIDAAGGEVYLAYWEMYGSETNTEIIFRRREAGSWMGPVRVSDAPGKSELPCLIAEPNGNVHIAWVDSRDGNQEIYYREYINPSSGTGGDDPDRPPVVPAALAISSSPNPFFGSTSITLNVPDACRGTIVVFDVQGRRVRTVVAGRLPRGATSFAWDGADDAGRALPPGLYFAAARAGKLRVETKIVLIR